MITAPNNIRNVAFIGFHHSGKTTLVESLLFLTGATNRRGTTKEGTTVTDYEPEAIARQMSTQVSVAHTSYREHLFNIFDCPGFIDFTEEVKLALLGADIAVFVVEPACDRIVQIDELLHFTEDLGIARIVFVNKLDKPDTNYGETLDALNALMSNKAHNPLVPVHLPIREGGHLTGYMDTLKAEAFKYLQGGALQSQDIPEDLRPSLEQAHEVLIERLADTDDAIIEKVLEGNEPPMDLLEDDLKKAVRQGLLMPVLVGSGQTDAGITCLLDAIIALCPSPIERHFKDREGQPLEVFEDGPMLAQIVKTYIHPQSGKLSVCRVISGAICGDQHLVDTTTGTNSERIGGLYSIMGKKQEPMPKAVTGSIVAVARLEKPKTGDTLVGSRDHLTTTMWVPPLPPPLYCLAIAPKTRADEAKLSTLLHKLLDEDPVLRLERDPDTQDYLLGGQGEVHLTESLQKLERKYHIQVTTERPKVAYRETIQKTVEAHGRHKKQTGGHGQFADVFVNIEPLDRGAGNKFTESIVGGVVPRQYIPGVEKGVMEALQRGPQAGYPVVDVAVNLFGGSYHDVDSDEMSFRMAAILAMREGLPKANPIILEPVAEVAITTPSMYTSGVLGQVTGRRGHILGYGASESRGAWDEIHAHIPQRELWNYIIELRTLTHGLGFYTWKFSHLSPVPPSLAEELKNQKEQAVAAS